jgi:antitoxin component YwqK of YwqJK toxin-antitoxin module
MKLLSKHIILIALAVTILSAACHPVREEIIQKYPNGKPMLVFLVKGDKKAPIRVGERMYYENGQLQFEKNFTGSPEVPDGIWKYYFDNGQIFATGDFTQNHEFGNNWVFMNRNGNPYYDGKLDSVIVTDMGTFGTPSTVAFCSDNHQDIIQFYSNFTVRSTERLTDGMRDGRVFFYFPNGNIQVEANFVNGVEDGPYTVYRQNGVPFYQGNYQSGKRIGIWEFYDEEGNLDNTVDYSKNTSSQK